MISGIYQRLLETAARRSLADTRVVMITGPRQAGKTTFLKQLSVKGRTYVTLDDAATLDAATTDPTGFIRNLGSAAIDEVQRAPRVLLAIKQAVDEHPIPGRFLLSGSADVMMLPTVADSLAGRIETHTLLPLAQAELLGTVPTFLSNVFVSEKPKAGKAVNGFDLLALVVAGGYPEALKRTTHGRRAQWYASYVETIIQRDIRDVASVAETAVMARLLSAVAEHAAKLVNYSELGGQLGLSHVTTQKYVGALELVFLLKTVQPYFNATLKRLIKTPKVQFFDSGLLAAMMGVDSEAVGDDRKLFGNLLESFVFGELAKLCTVHDGRVHIFHYRDKEQNEIDFVLEDERHRIVGVEVKASATVTSSDFRALARLARANGKRFASGIVLYDGTQVLPFGSNMWAAPISCLWGSS